MATENSDVLATLLTQKRNEASKLEARLKELKEFIAVLDKESRKITTLMVGIRQKPALQLTLDASQVAGLTSGQAMMHYLKFANAAKKTADIAQALIDAGYFDDLTKAKVNTTGLLKRYKKNGRVARHGDGWRFGHD